MSRRIPLVAASLAAAFFLQCDGGGDEPEGPLLCEGSIPTGVVYPDENRASDEALERVWESRCRASNAKGFVLSSPEDGAVVPAAAPVEIRWEPLVTQSAFLGLRFGIARAHAHLPPITGDVHLVELAPAGGGTPLYVFTADTWWTPGDEEWSRLVAMGEIRVTVWSAHLEKGVILDEAADGPFVSPKVGRFTIEGA
ncbi:MAG TPA: hypothetical protein VN033_05540 [Vulgatibacter sp.]|nr:hypothetical protein [Vulgatibacter sp.]